MHLFTDKSDGKRRNTLGHLDRYEAQIVNKLDTSALLPQMAFTCHVVDDFILENNMKKLYKKCQKHLLEFISTFWHKMGQSLEELVAVTV